MECPNGFLNPALCHVVFLARMKQGTVCGGFPFYLLNPLLGEGCAQRDLEERHGNSLEYQGSFSTEMESSRTKWPVPTELCRWTRTILCVKNELALPGTQRRWESPQVLSAALGMEPG